MTHYQTMPNFDDRKNSRPSRADDPARETERRDYTPRRDVCFIIQRERGPHGATDCTIEVACAFNPAMVKGMKLVPTNERSASGPPEWKWYFRPEHLARLKALACNCKFASVWMVYADGSQTDLIRTTQLDLFNQTVECPECRARIEVRAGLIAEHYVLSEDQARRGRCRASLRPLSEVQPF